MNVLFALLAISGLGATVPAGPEWLREYIGAREQGRTEEKPIAVFIGSGNKGWNLVSREGQLGREVMEILAREYVCLYVDTKHDEGRQLASAFDMGSGLGLVISSHTGQTQAFRHQGDLENDDLAHYLRRYADPERTVSYTESTESIRTSMSPAPQAPGSAGYIPLGGPARTC